MPDSLTCVERSARYTKRELLPYSMQLDRLKSIHRISGLVLVSFFLLHIFNHLCALGGASLHIEVMQLLRRVYRFPPVEVVLLLSVGVQIVSGLRLVWQKGFRKNMYDVMQVGSGLYLSFFLFYHLRAVLLGRHIWKVDTDFHFAAWGVNHMPDKLFFIPYYAMSVLAVFVHLACVHRQKMLALKKVEDATISIKRQFGLIILAGGLVTLLIMIGLHNA